LNSVFESIEIGAVSNVRLIDFDKEIVILKVTEPIDPSDLDLLTEFAIV